MNFFNQKQTIVRNKLLIFIVVVLVKREKIIICRVGKPEDEGGALKAKIGTGISYSYHILSQSRSIFYHFITLEQFKHFHRVQKSSKFPKISSNFIAVQPAAISLQISKDFFKFYKTAVTSLQISKDFFILHSSSTSSRSSTLTIKDSAPPPRRVENN